MQISSSGNGNLTLCLLITAILGLVAAIIGIAVAFSQTKLAKCNDNIPLGVEFYNASLNEHIGIVFAACPTDGAFNAFIQAKDRWNAILKGTPVSGGALGSDIGTRSLCGTDTNLVFPKGFVFDHLVIVAETIAQDGVGGILAQAGPCSSILDQSASAFPLLGVMQFDTADLADIEQKGVLDEVITHEMAHVLGFGTNWKTRIQNGVRATTGQEDQILLQDPVFPLSGGVNTVNPPKFEGTNALTQYNLLRNPDVTFVPVEDGKNELDPENPTFFNVAAGQGKGSADGHWKKTTFDTELMTFNIAAGTPHPLSAVTFGSLLDLGYTVSEFGLADPYSLPANSVQPSDPSTRSANLRGRVVGLGDGVNLSGDATVFGPRETDDVPESEIVTIKFQRGG